MANLVCLCFENWDRFGRDIEWKNTKRFLDLIQAGASIGVVSMNIVIDQKVLTENSSIPNPPEGQKLDDTGFEFSGVKTVNAEAPQKETE